MTLPFVPDILARPDDVEMPPVEGPDNDDDDVPALPDDAEAEVEDEDESQTDLPTQAGLPIFDDETDDVSWLEKRRDPPPPPPPVE